MRLACLLGCLLVMMGTRMGWAAPPATDTLRLNYADSGPFGHYFTACFDSYSHPNTGRQAVKLWATDRFQFHLSPAGVLQGGYRPARLWLRAVVVNTLPQRTRFVWSLYEFVDSATLFVQSQGRGVPQARSRASSRVVASRRPFPARAVCLPFWLDAHEQAVLYLRVENHTGAWCLPTDISTAEGFLRFENTYLVYTHWVWLLGFYVGSALFNLVLYGFLRDRIHLWYWAYVLFGTWFLLMEDSVDALLLPQGVYWLGWQISEFGVLLLALACGLRIMALFLRLKRGWPRLHRLSWGLSAVAAGYALAYPLLFGLAQSLAPVAVAWLNAGRDALLWVLLLAGAGLLGVVAGRGRATQRRLALVYAATYACFLGGSMGFLLDYAGLTYLTLVEPNILAWGLALEFITVTILLTGRFRHSLRQTTNLRLRQLREREAAARHLIQAQEAEREALARELHDALAPGLTTLHLAWQGRLVRAALAEAPPLLQEAHRRTEALLRQLRHEVRTLSQALHPPMAGQQPPLPEAVGLLIDALGLADNGPDIACHCDPAAANLPEPLQQTAYRIVAELLHNALRHAQAHRITVTVRRQPDHLLLAVADDGHGFDPAQAPHAKSMGLRGVEARVRYLHGQTTIVSQPKAGTTVTVVLPL